MIRLLQRALGGSSLSLAIIYTIGHIIIAIICVSLITGASLELAAIDALVEHGNANKVFFLRAGCTYKIHYFGGKRL